MAVVIILLALSFAAEAQTAGRKFGRGLAG